MIPLNSKIEPSTAIMHFVAKKPCFFLHGRKVASFENDN
jgi:hypothetical protein